MAIDNYQISLKVFLQNKNGETLILESPSHFDNWWFYDVPGGRIDVDEFDSTYVDILQREIAEELWVDIVVKISEKPVSFARGSFSGLHIFYVYFVWECISGDIVLSEEHISLKWVKLDEISPAKYFQKGLLEWVQSYLKYK